MSRQTLARIAGLLYFAVAVLGGFSEYVRESARAAGDASATAAYVAQHATLFRIAFAADLADLPCFLSVGLILYVLLRPVNGPIAIAMLVLNAVSVAVQALNMLNHAAALLVATDPRFSAGLSAGAAQSLVATMLEMHRLGYLVAQIFFGLYLLPLGYLVFRSGFLPRVLGIVLMVGCAGYALGVVASFASPAFTSSLATPSGLVGGLAELAFLLWLVVMGVGTQATAHELKGAVKWSA